MVLKRYFAILFAVCVCQSIYSQLSDDFTVQMVVEDVFEQLVEQEKEVDYEQLAEQLIYVYENPIDINNATENQLLQLPFLSQSQIDALLLFVYQKPIQSLAELRLVDGLEQYELRNLLPFLKVEEQKADDSFYWSDFFHQLTNDLQIRLNAANLENFNGDPLCATVKYQLRYADKMRLGLTLDRDANEPFYYPHKTYGPDFYGGYLELSNIKQLQKFVLGDYKASFGQGLVINTNVSLQGKRQTYNNGFVREGVQAKTSAAEYNFLRGAAATVKLGNFRISALYSARKVDAKITDGVFPSVQQTGYHRTDNELENKRTEWQQTAAANLTYSFKQLRIGLTIADNLYADSIKPIANYYNFNYFRGKNQLSAGINYNYQWRWLQFQGEVATAQNKKWGWATVNRLSLSPISDLRFNVVHRYYSNYFDCYLAQSFAESSRMIGEHGLFAGAEISRVKKLNISAYIDVFKYDMPTYTNRLPSEGFDVFTEFVWKVTPTIDMLWRAKVKNKNSKHTYSLRYVLGKRWTDFSIKFLAEGNICNPNEAAMSLGGLVQANLNYQPTKLPFVAQMRVEAFYAQNYNNRFYLYENDVLYAFSVPMLYGEGMRYYANFRYKFGNSYALYLKVAQTIYFQSWQMSQQLTKATHTDIHLMLRIKI